MPTCVGGDDLMYLYFYQVAYGLRPGRMPRAVVMRNGRCWAFYFFFIIFLSGVGLQWCGDTAQG